jgi:hypothetical protein
MKKLLFILTMFFFSITMMGQKMSNYEKYKLQQEKTESVPITHLDNDSLKATKVEYDDLYYQPSIDNKKIKQKKQNVIDTSPDVIINYYDSDPFYYSYNIGRFYHRGFNYWMYDNYDWYYSYPLYNDFYFGYNYWNLWRYNYNNVWHHQYYGNAHYNNFKNTYYSRRERPSTSSNDRRISTPTAPIRSKSISESRRSYTPSYTQPRMSSRPAYNNSKSEITSRRVAPQQKSSTSTPIRREYTSPTQRSTYNRSYSSPVQNSRPSYSAPPTSSNRSYNNSTQRSSVSSSSSNRRR